MDEAQVFAQRPVQHASGGGGGGVLRLGLAEPPLGEEAAEEGAVTEQTDVSVLTETLHASGHDTSIDDGAGYLVRGDGEAGIEEHLQVGRVRIGEAYVADPALGLEAGEMGEVVDVCVVCVVPDMVLSPHQLRVDS